jgi:hypothetical protein
VKEKKDNKELLDKIRYKLKIYNKEHAISCHKLSLRLGISYPTILGFLIEEKSIARFTIEKLITFLQNNKLWDYEQTFWR